MNDDEEKWIVLGTFTFYRATPMNKEAVLAYVTAHPHSRANDIVVGLNATRPAVDRPPYVRAEVNAALYELQHERKANFILSVSGAPLWYAG